jgi:hypothetical protein
MTESAVRAETAGGGWGSADFAVFGMIIVPFLGEKEGDQWKGGSPRNNVDS